MTTYPRFYALSGTGYGRGNTPGEAIENYVEAQARNWRSTIYKSRAAFEKVLRAGDARPQVWLVPEGTWGHMQSTRLYWLSGDEEHPTYTEALANQLLDFNEYHRENFREVEVVTVTQPKGEEGGAYRLVLPDGQQVVIGDGTSLYGALAVVIDDAFEGVRA